MWRSVAVCWGLIGAVSCVGAAGEDVDGRAGDGSLLQMPPWVVEEPGEPGAGRPPDPTPAPTPDGALPLCAQTCAMQVNLSRRAVSQPAHDSASAGPLVMPFQYMWAAPQGDESAQASRIFSFEQTRGLQEHLHAPGAELVLAAGGESSFLFWQVEDGSARLLGKGYNSEPVELARVAGRPPFEALQLSGQGIGVLENGCAAAWIDEGATHKLVRACTAPSSLTLPPAARLGLTLNPWSYAAAWVEPVAGDPDREAVFWWRDGAPVQLATRQRSPHTLALVSDWVYWLDGGEVWRAVPGGAPPERVALPAPCNALHAGWDSAVAACGPGVDPGAALPTGATQIYRLRPEQPAALLYQASPDRFIVSPRLHSRLAWVEYPAAQDLCGAAGSALGEIKLLQLHYDGSCVQIPATVVRAGIAAPCLCCDAYAPPISIDMYDKYLAWRYDAEDGALGMGGAHLAPIGCSY